MSRRPDPWAKVPREPAHVWSGKGCSLFDLMVGQHLCIALGCAEGPIPGELESAIEHSMRGVVSGRDRQHFRRAVARLRARGLLFEHEGKVYLLLSETLWREHRALSERYADKKPILTLVRPETATPLAAERRANVERTLKRRRSDIENEVSARNHSGPSTREREREILRENATRSAAAEPPPAANDQGTGVREKPPEPKPLAKAKRTRARTPLDDARDRAVAVFNELWSPMRGHGASWSPARGDFGLLTTMVQSYLRTDGSLNEPLYRLAVLAWLRRDSWANYGGWQPQTFLRHHLGGLTTTQSTGTDPVYEYDF